MTWVSKNPTHTWQNVWPWASYWPVWASEYGRKVSSLVSSTLQSLGLQTGSSLIQMNEGATKVGWLFWLYLLGLWRAPRREMVTPKPVSPVPRRVKAPSGCVTRNKALPSLQPLAAHPWGKVPLHPISLRHRVEIWERMLFLLSRQGRGVEGKMSQYFTLLLQHWVICVSLSYYHRSC